jgi:hypothetical protein
MVRKIVSIYIGVHPAGRGMANCSWNVNGEVNGGHLSGDNPPFVHIDKEQFPKETIDLIWNEAMALDETVLSLDMSPDPKWKGHTELSITFDTGKGMRVCWPFGDVRAPPAGGALHPQGAAGEREGGRLEDEGIDPRVRKLVELLMKHRIGCW